MSFTTDYSHSSFIRTILKYSIWTIINYGLMYYIRYLDNETYSSDTLVVLLSFPVGATNFFSLFFGFRALKNFNWLNLLYCASCLLNFCIWASIGLELESQVGGL